MPKLPRTLEADPRHAAVETALSQAHSPLWTGGTLAVAHLPFTPALEQALIAALRSHHLERGLEHIEKTLDSEQLGIVAARTKAGAGAANRLSRVVLVANDGAERFYRQCESMLKRHADRAVGLHLGVSSSRLSEKLFGADKLVRAVLVSDRDSVVNVLLSLAEASA